MYTHILHATDLSETHFELCEQAVALSKKLGASLSLIHVIETPVSLQVSQGLGFSEISTPVKDDAEIVMHVLGDALHLPKSQLFVETGPVKQCVLEKLTELHCDLLVIGSHRPHDLSELLGTTARSLVEHAPSDVLTLRTQR
ncbi:MAG: universal stress protein [Legionellaceae bacterium]|nr:universal stress protein [Legionellaceae bacterium]